jgi:CRISPR/Cas system Type II protein with McrA/HNH and RuvC-like nuclease domain
MYTATIPDNHQVSRDEFCKAFRGHHLLVGIMHHNLREFLDLQQGTDDVYEYTRKFNYLAQYDTHHVDTDEKKEELFRRGLSLLLQDRLVQFCDLSFNTLMCAAIAQDGTYRALLADEEEKRKWDLSEPADDSTEGAPLKYHLVYTPSASKLRVPPPSP